MFRVIGAMMLSVIVGYAARNIYITHKIAGLVKYTVWLLLFLLGASVGMDRNIINNLGHAGIQSLVLALAGMLGAMSAAKIVYGLFFKKEDNSSGNIDIEQKQSGSEDIEPKENAGGMRESLIIVGFFVAGIAAGLAGILPEGLPGSGATMYALYALVICVGLGIGSDPKLKEILRTLRPKLLLIPLATIIGTLTFSGASALILKNISVADGLAIGSGFTYYSLSSVLISELKAATAGEAFATYLGIIALTVNVIKEICTLLAAPLMVKFFGPFAPICTGGAASMDTLLPAIVNASGTKWTFVAILHGVIVDFSVPVFVTFFCSL